MATLQLTQASTGNKFDLNEEDIIWVVSDTLGAKVQWRSERDGQRLEMVVSESPSSIAAASKTLIQITTIDADTPYISISRIGTIDPTGTYVKFDYNVEGATRRPIQITTSYSAFMATKLAKEGYTVYDFDEVSATNDTISLTAATGDKSANFTSGVAFTVFGSSTATMNTIWVTSSSTYGTKTVITVTGAIPTGASETGKLYLIL